METIIAAIQNTPIPTILILAGLLFLLLGFVTKLGGIVEVSPEQKRLAFPIGLLVLAIGLLLNFIPTNDHEIPEQHTKSEADSTAPPKSTVPPTPAVVKTQAPASPKQEVKVQDVAVAHETKPPIENATTNRTRWLTFDFPPPNGGLLVYTITPDGDPACASYDGANCLWGLVYDQVDFKRLKTLVCGEGHRAKWGVTGYEDPKHWCNLAVQTSKVKPAN